MMRGLLVSIRLALHAIRRNVLRTCLTVLGILIGVFAVVAITAVGSAARDRIGGQVQSLGSNLIVVFPHNRNSAAKGTVGVYLSDDDVRAIKREASSVAEVSPSLRALSQAVVAERNRSVQVFGSTLPSFTIGNDAVLRGALWTERDESSKAKVCVIGETTRQNLFGDQDPVGRYIRLGRHSYLVVALLKPKGQDPWGNDQDDAITMPISSFRARILHTPPNFAGAVLLSATSPETIDRAMIQVESLLRQRHRIPEGQEADFEVHSQKELSRIYDTIINVLTLVLVAVAAISLLVGGIGVMNIMLVSVTERTREIGIRMAIGAREADIRQQFLIEAVVLTALGGVAGVVLAIGGIQIASRVFDVTMSVSPVALVVSVVTSAMIGVSFGYFPARRASRLDPIVALRHE